ncbi:Crp/Fnr family transcriptional regulator [Flavobacterium sp. IB48]|uniref:Crp/Fnr family transcriptional regulator n=1 Tax=Flavobacterium sp. IB48 TaxID=2779375 RepID=UPI0018E8FD27|nr:Crp/Fnr family transcriptional regulator [Flavobacterium sp. IB48]MBJ2124195.1 Crp/Fnr family transcriptional regulator [Flavobacterium sp. IB48]
MFSQFRNRFPLTDEKWNEYIGYFNRIEVLTKTTLLEEGEVSKKLYIIEKGCIRVWFNNNGKDLTTQFFFENESVASIESFMKKLPSPTNIETIEPSVLWWIHKNDLDKILEEIKEIPALRDSLINKLFERTFDYMKYFVSFIKDSPAERYVNLIQQRPQIILRVPQHYIASYLGITTVHLSRLKNKLVNKNN